MDEAFEVIGKLANYMIAAFLFSAAVGAGAVFGVKWAGGFQTTIEFKRPLVNIYTDKREEYR